MRLFLFLLLIWNTQVFGESITSITAKDSPLFGVEQEARAIPIENVDYRKYQVLQQDSHAEAYKKLIVLSRCIGPRKDFGELAAFYFQNAEIASKNYPYSAPVAVLYAEAGLFAPRESLLLAIEPLIPFLTANDQVPGIARIINSILERTQDNLVFQGKQVLYIQKFVGGDSYEETLKRLALMKDYWAAKISPEYSKKWTKEMLDKSNQVMIPEKIAEAEEYWAFLLKNLMKNNDRMAAMDIINSIADEKVKRAKEQNVRDNELFDAQFEDARRKIYDKFKSGLTDFADIQNTFLFLSAFKNKLEDNQHIPEYEKLIETYANSEDAKILDAAFFIYSLKNYSRALEILERLQCKDSNIIALQLRIFATLWAGNKSPASKSKALDLIDMTLELDPQNQNARQLKIRLKK